MLLLFSISGEEITRALSWTLFHSLWQGMLLSLVAGCIVFFTKKASPALRYNLLAASLLVFIISITATFSIQILKARQFVNASQMISAERNITIESTNIFSVVGNDVSMTDKVIAFFNANANWIVLTWLLIIGLQFIRLTVGLYGIHQLRRRQIFSPGEYWNNRMTELSRQLQINKQVQLLQSGIAKVPAVIGFFKPVVLFPAGLLAALPADEVEAILIHELAHIRRRDFLVNVLQNMIEIIFFFNPAVLWVSSLIKSERENCCDDVAVSQTVSKQNYIKALLAFEAFNLPLSSPLANAFSGEKNHLMNRIKRIIYNNNKTLNNMEKKFLAAGMVIASVFIFAFSANNTHLEKIANNTTFKNIGLPATDNTTHRYTAVSDTLPTGNKEQAKQSLQTTVNGKKYMIVTDNGQVTELYESGKKVPEEKVSSYQSLTSKIILQTKLDMEKAQKDMELAAKDMAHAQKEIEEAKNSKYEQEKYLAEAKQEMEKSKIEMALDMEQGSKEIEEAKLEMKQHAGEMEQAQKELLQSKKYMEQATLQMEQAKKGMATDMQKARKDMEFAKMQMLQSKIDMEKSVKDLERSKKEMEQSKILQEKIVDDFIVEHIIKDKKELISYTLSDKELIVNGVKQPDIIFKKFKNKYVKTNNWSMSYNNNDEAK